MALELKYDELLSSLVLNFNLRLYSMDTAPQIIERWRAVGPGGSVTATATWRQLWAFKEGQCRLTVSKPVLKAPNDSSV